MTKTFRAVLLRTENVHYVRIKTEAEQTTLLEWKRRKTLAGGKSKITKNLRITGLGA
jgi:hypothetical protein